MSVAKVRGKGQITIPAEVRERAHIGEGTLIEFEVTSEGVLMRPYETVPADQAWFWTPEWQEGEREASADIAAGRTTFYGSTEDFLAALRERS